jgi:putative inorganic carbon (hco3(-)) transporter
VQRTLLIILVAASYLLLAGGRPWTLAPLIGLALLAALAAPRRTAHFPSDHRILDLALIALVIAIGVQLLPLPVAVVDVISPNATRLKQALQFTPLSAPGGWTSLSIQPQRTLEALAAAVIGVLSFWTARAVFSVGGNTRAFCRALALIGAIVAIAAMIQKASTPKLLLFSVQPEARSTNPFGAFTNRNHFAAWLMLVATPITGYLIARMRMHESRDHRLRAVIREFMASGAVMTALGAVLTLGVLAMTLSRSAVIGLGVAGIVAWRFGVPRIRLERSALPARLGGIGMLLIVAMMFIDLDGWATRVGETFTAEGMFGRATIWKETAPIIKDFWLTGTGAGTYSNAMTYYQQTRMWVNSMQRWAHFNNAHSHYIQVAAEGGVLLAAPALVALVSLSTLARRTLRADKGEMFWVRVGAAAGLAGMATQSLFEVSLTMPANAVLCGVLAALLLCRRESRSSGESMTPELLTPHPRTSVA